MTALSEEAAAAARTTRQLLAGDKLRTGTAKLYSQHIRLATGQGRLPSFDTDEFEMRLRDAVVLVDASLHGRERNEADWNAGLRRAAEILEWLAHPEVSSGDVPLRLLSAAAYHLAGFPARAGSLARLAGDEAGDSPLLRLLLQADFSSLLDLAVDVAASEPRRDNGAEEMSETQQLSLEVHEAVAGEVAAALGVICAELRWGRERRAGLAVAKLRAAATALVPFADPYSWLCLRLVAEVAEQAVQQSLRNLVRPLGAAVERDGRQALERYVRGAYASGRILAWPSQARGLDRLASGGSFALCTPTGSGKTTVAEIALLEGLFREDGESGSPPALCLYVVPTRALAAEVEGRLSRALRGVGGRRAVAVTGLYGGTDWGPTDAWLSADDPTVLVCTQEKAEAVVRFFGAAVIRRIRLVVIDEAHEVQEATRRTPADLHESRPLRLEMLVARLRAQLQEGTRFVALSAVAQGIQVPLARWVSGGEDPDPVVLHYRSTRQVIGRLRCRSGGRTRIELDLLDGQPLELADQDEGPFVPAPFSIVPPSSDMDGPQKGLAPYALWAAMQLADARREQGGQSVLISIAQHVGNWSKWLNDLLDQWTEVELPRFFSEPAAAADSRLFERALIACEDYFGTSSREYRLLARGIVVHHGKMPGRLPRLLVELVERRIVRIVVATSTLSQGVNLPFETIVIPSLRRHSGPMSGRELGNLAGRAGRPGVSTEGQTLVLLLEDQERWRVRAARNDYEAALAEIAGAQANDGPSSGLAHLIDAVQRLGPQDPEELEAWLETTAPLAFEGGEEEADGILALDALDAVLLAALEEAHARTPAAAEEAVRTVWRQTFARYAAAAEGEMERLIIRRARGLSEIYGDQEQRTRIYRTGLPARDAERLDQVVPDVLQHLSTGEDFADWDNEERLEYIRRTIEILRGIPRFSGPETIGHSSATWEDALAWWLHREEADRLPGPAQIANWHDFVSEHFGYRFNWALAGVLSSVQTTVGGAPGSLDIWGGGGVPWAGWWIKDLVGWGTLDPAAAFLLARGGIDARPDAEAAAEEYWAQDHEGDPMNPAAVRAWVAGRTQNARPRRLRPPRRMEVDLVAPFTESQAERLWRVLPRRQGGDIAWTDPAGVELARGPATRNWEESIGRTFDFRLDVNERIVQSRRYV